MPADVQPARSETEKPETEKPLSVLLRELAEGEDSRVSVDLLTERFGGRALGGLLLIFGLLCLLPLPPGATTLFGAPILLLAPQLMFNSGAPWLPVKMREQSVDTRAFANGLERVIPWIERVEAISRPRLGFLFGPPGLVLTGLVCTVLGLVLILPIPLGNMLPAAAVSMLSLSLVQRDGVLAFLGYMLAVASGGVLVLAAGIIVRAAQHALMVFTGA